MSEGRQSSFPVVLRDLLSGRLLVLQGNRIVDKEILLKLWLNWRYIVFTITLFGGKQKEKVSLIDAKMTK